ncbi:glycosyltransferase [Paenibacillus hamazuiensis]|uniref:glycosyltransferase n=1 Tax=Paenibacillus hamazuiensis TaxID=2936508 RepID=UPI00200C2B50|nr:glycosyltransferase [Paenibacillus hamazuiensis]
MNPNIVTVLCSGFGLGFYNPGLIVSHQLRRRGFATEVLVFETYMVQDKQDKILDSKKAYHDNFAVALVATKIPKDIRDSIDFAQVDRLLGQWAEERRRHFISLSGHWIYILDMYREKLGALAELQVDLLYVDSDLSPSWKGLKKFNPDYNARYRDVWLYDARERTIPFYIQVGDEEEIPLAQRPSRYVVHGGGWGMGTYQGKIPELEQHGLALDIVAYELEEALAQKPGNRYYMNDPQWVAWRKGRSGEHEFPLFGQIKPEEPPVYANLPSHHGLYEVIRRAKAIVSKPGAGTLMDSLSSATPVIMLEPFGAHEKQNAAVWEANGLGISYETWKESGFSEELLEPVHRRLLQRKAEARNYTEDLIGRIG